jgi:branched-chain amino acid transport system permease protein
VNEFIGLLISGLSLGFVYALIALGFVVVFKATRVVNFAHGSVLLLGVYVIARLQESAGFALALVAGVLAAALCAVLLQVLIIRRVRDADLGTLAILTIGINIVLATELTRRIGTDALSIGDPWGDDIVEIASFTVPAARIAAGVVAIVLLLGFLAMFRFTDWGIAMRAAAADSETAALMGIRLNRVAAATWALAGALAAIGGVFLTTFPTPGVDSTVGLSALHAFPAAILGGLDSTAGAVVGGVAIGVVATLSAGYQSDLTFLGNGLAEVMPYVVMVVVLLARPWGLFGTRELTRV